MAALLLAAAAILGGALASYGFDRDSPGYARIATGCVIGMTTLAFAGFILALGLGMGPATLVAAAVVTLLPAVLLRDADVRVTIRRDVAEIVDRVASTVRRPTIEALVTAVYGLLVALGVWLVAGHTFFETSDGLSIGNVNNLGDLPYHVQISASFAYGANFPPQNPVFSGSGFSYHYIADFLAAMYVAAGASLVQGMLILNVALGASLLVLIHRWTRTLTGSAVAARLAPPLLALSGGLGWVMLLDQARTGGQGLIGAFNSGDRYTIQPDGLLRFGNAVTTLLIPQRGLLLGMGLAVIVFTLLWRQLGERVAPPEAAEPARARLAGRLPWPNGGSRMLVAGVFTGILPIVHAHTFAVVFGTAFLLGVCFTQWREGRWRSWVVYVVATIALALPILAWTARGSQASLSAFFGVELFWDHGTADPIWFWFTNTGAFIPILVAAFAWRGEGRLPRNLLLYSLPFVAWFVVPNVLRVAPWLWDNIKLLTYWWLGSVPIVALVLARLWERRSMAKIAAVALAFVLMAAGALDIVRAAVGPAYQEFDRDGIAFAEMIREKTPATAVILTEPTYNTAVFLTGRRVFMGYAGFLWANGLPYVEREQQVHAIYTGDPSADDLLARNGIQYIVDGPQERADATYPPNEAYLSKFPVVAVSGEYRLLEVPKS
jgi:hypothetical protein